MRVRVIVTRMAKQFFIWSFLRGSKNRSHQKNIQTRLIHAPALSHALHAGFQHADGRRKTRRENLLFCRYNVIKTSAIFYVYDWEESRRKKNCRKCMAHYLCTLSNEIFSTHALFFLHPSIPHICFLIRISVGAVSARMAQLLSSVICSWLNLLVFLSFRWFGSNRMFRIRRQNSPLPGVCVRAVLCPMAIQQFRQQTWTDETEEIPIRT